MLCSHPSLAISRKQLSLLPFVMFISFKLEQMIYYVLKIRLKRSQKERHKRGRERERERGDKSLYLVLHLSL